MATTSQLFAAPLRPPQLFSILLTTFQQLSSFFMSSHLSSTFSPLPDSSQRMSLDMFPTCQVRVVRFYVRCAALPASCHPSSLLRPPSCLAGPHLPALDRSGPRRTSAGENLSAVGLAGHQPDPNGQKQSHTECQIECQIECQKICQIECQR